MYTENSNQVEKKTAKGIKKSVTKREIRHSGYNDCLFEKKQTITYMNQIRSQNHQIYSITSNKITLTPYDDKCFILKNGYHSLLYGHDRTK